MKKFCLFFARHELPSRYIHDTFEGASEEKKRDSRDAAPILSEAG
jgi:hypothetical protein